ITLIVAPDEGVTHCPPMKNRSGCRIGTLMSFASLIWAPSRRPDSHIVTRSLDRRDVAAKRRRGQPIARRSWAIPQGGARDGGARQPGGLHGDALGDIV